MVIVLLRIKIFRFHYLFFVNKTKMFSYILLILTMICQMKTNYHYISHIQPIHLTLPLLHPNYTTQYQPNTHLHLHRHPITLTHPILTHIRPSTILPTFALPTSSPHPQPHNTSYPTRTPCNTRFQVCISLCNFWGMRLSTEVKGSPLYDILQGTHIFIKVTTMWQHACHNVVMTDVQKP